MRKRAGYFILMALAVMLAGCGKNDAESSAAAGEDSGRTMVTMMFTADLTQFEDLVETTYPDIDLQVERLPEAVIDGEIERRLRDGRGPDIVTTAMPTGDVRRYVTDLSAESYIDRYQTAVFQSISDEGRMMFIPLPGQYYGYIYNAAFRKQGGIPVPTTQLGILDMLDDAAGQGLGTGRDGVLFAAPSSMTTVSTWLMATQVPDFLSRPKGIKWYKKMLNGEAGFAEGMSNCLKLPSLLTERGYFNSDALYPNYEDNVSHNNNEVTLEGRMLEGSLMMVYGSTRLLTRLNQNSDKYQFEILPFMGNEGRHPWTITVPDAYLSINAKLGEAGENARRDACSRILDLLSTPEGQAAYIMDCGTAYSFLTAYDPEQGTPPEGLRKCIEEGYVYNIRLPGRLRSYFGRQMIAVLSGDLTMEEALAAVDQYRSSGEQETAAGETEEDRGDDGT